MLTRLSLRYSIPLLLLLFTLLLVAVLSMINIPRYEREAELAWKQHASQLLAVIQGNINDHLRLHRTDEMVGTLSDLSSLDGVRWALVVDPSMQLASSRLGVDLATYPDLESILKAGVPYWQRIGEHHFVALYPLRAGNGLSAEPGHALLVDWDFSPMIRAQLREAWLQQGEIPLLMLVLGAFIAYLYNQLVTHRLAALGAVTEDFANGNHQARATIDGQDEISLLGRQLNSMIVQIETDRYALRRNELLLRSLIEAAPIGMLILDESGQTESANPAAARLFNCQREELAHRQVSELLGDVSLWPRLLDNANQGIEVDIPHPGHNLAMELSCTPFQRNGHPQFLLLMRDITDRRQAEQRLQYLAHHDSLTGTANRTQLLLQLEHSIQHHEAQALLFLDLDHFKRINDTLGHDVGDMLLQGVARRLQLLIPESALLARLGGDEFIILLSARDASLATPLAEQLLESFRDPFEVGQYELYTSPSIGITQHRHGHINGQQMLKEADLALYQAKNHGRNRIAHFDRELARDAEERRQLEDELRAALTDDQFELFYQPQVGLDGRVHTFEALLRWHSPTRGMVSPAVFLPVLEESGLIIEATQWVVRQACRQLRQWQEAGYDWSIAVNLSPLDFRQHDLASNLFRILDEEQIAGDQLELELTESALLDADRHVLKTMRLLKGRGMSLYLDDFGTGYASLTYLQHFPFDGVKIDQQFVRGLPDDLHSRALVGGILEMARQLGMEVVAEGIETEAQASYLRNQQCQRLQGYLFSRPMPAAEATAIALQLGQ